MSNKNNKKLDCNDNDKQAKEVSFLAVGIAIGVAVGVAIKNVALGLAIGLAIGVAIDLQKPNRKK